MTLLETAKEGPVTQVYHVDIREHREWHYATSEELPGLFVAHKECDIVMSEIPECIQMLLEHNTGHKVTVSEAPALSPRLLGKKVYTATTDRAA